MTRENYKNKEWWRKTVVYQIYPRSYYDSNGDGIGDIAGIISKLDYIKQTGFETIWISPFFKSPQKDFGYDISDYYSIASEYGTKEDVETLVQETHKRGMYIIFDMVLNHTSDQHPWFIESRSSKNNPKREWYIWKDAKKNGKPPTNWISQTGGSGWQWDEKTSQYYWAAFLPFQPDLNYRNPEVKKEIYSMLNYWLKKGVDGFRLDIIGSIYEDKEFRDSPFVLQLLPNEENKGMLFKSKCMTENLPESKEFTKELRKITDDYNSPERFMVGETFGSLKEVANFCKNKGLHSGFAFKCTEVSFSAKSFYKLIKDYEKEFPSPLKPVWAFSNHDRTRRISALGGNVKKAKLNIAFQLTVRGIPFFYYGEEIGIEDANLNHKNSLDPVSYPFKKLPLFIFNLINKKIHGALNRDRVRTPMQWDSTANAGFCSKNANPWLPVNNNYENINVQNQEKDPNSILSCMKRFLKIRLENESLQSGDILLTNKILLSKNVLSYTRKYKDDEIFILLNFNNKKINIELEALNKGIILASTENISAKRVNKKIFLNPYQGIIIRAC